MKLSNRRTSCEVKENGCDRGSSHHREPQKLGASSGGNEGSNRELIAHKDTLRGHKGSVGIESARVIERGEANNLVEYSNTALPDFGDKQNDSAKFFGIRSNLVD